MIQHHVKTKLDDQPAEEDASIIEVEDEGDESKVGRSSLLNGSSDDEPPQAVVKSAKKKTSDEDSDDKFERCKPLRQGQASEAFQYLNLSFFQVLREQREKAKIAKPAPMTTKKKMDSFIVDDDEIDESESESGPDHRTKKGTSKKKLIAASSSDDDQVDHKDLQLFYIRTTKKFEEKTK